MWRNTRIAGAWLLVTVLGMPAPQAAGPFTLTSPQLRPGGRIAERQILRGFGCSGGNESPALAWTDAPPGTRSFALLMYDPDAPTGSGWWHWVVYDIPSDLTGLPAGAGDPGRHLMPAGAVQGRTDFGTRGYGGPCPPPGKPHHYYLRLYALRVPKLDVPGDATAAMVGYAVNGSAIAVTELMGVYGR